MESVGAAIVIPTLNEAEAITGVIAEIPRGAVRQIIVADSGSTDGTADLARAAGATAIVLDRRGYGRACAAGAAAASPDCDIIVFMDGDGADRGDLVANLIDPILRGTHDFVIASRTRGIREPGSLNWHQIAAGYVAGIAMGALYGVRYTDMCAFRAIRRDCLRRLDMREMGYGWNIEMQMKAARMRLRILELPMPYRCRSGGNSKVAGSLRGSLRAGYRIIATFLRVATAPMVPDSPTQSSCPDLIRGSRAAAPAPCPAGDCRVKPGNDEIGRTVIPLVVIPGLDQPPAASSRRT